MKLPLAYYGHPVLRKKSQLIKEITDDLKELIKNMEETMMVHDGIGIAAPQVFHSLALFLIHVPKQIGPDEWGKEKLAFLLIPKF